jgi:CRISPR/Cas system-associated exonuclease Cas4 (RecB family)
MDMLNALKKEKGTVAAAVDRHLASLPASDGDRRIDVNAPSAIGQCVRARWFSRTMPPGEGRAIDARTRRIFDNGSHVHLRLQQYMRDAGILEMDEVPVCSREYNIQGHTDGIASIGGELAIVEIKSINSYGFSALSGPKEDHKRQGLVYLYCVEERRKEIRAHIEKRGKAMWDAGRSRRRFAHRKLYSHVADGKKHSREEKIAFQARLHEDLDNLLAKAKKPITRVAFIYENKDNQEIKEFSVYSDTPESQAIIAEVLRECLFLNGAVERKEMPARPKGASCRFCDWKDECETAGEGGAGFVPGEASQ